MRQVPEGNITRPYLIVGNGRLAKHFGHYFSLLKIPYWHWWRGSTQSFRSLLEQSDKILLLINDDAIEDFIREHCRPEQDNQVWIHCSGLLSTPLAESAHPLMSFADTLFESDLYRRIPFITEKGRRQFPELFPELPNPNYTIPGQLKSLYHAWCVMSGNFTTLLWQRFFHVLEDQFELPRTVSYPYLNQISYNLKHSSAPLTGPLVRNDTVTVEEHLRSLEDDPYRQIYHAFVKAYHSLKPSKSGPS